MDDLTLAEAPAVPSAEGEHTLLHALVLVARHHGVHLSATQLSRDYGLTAAEPATKTLLRIATENGLVAREARLQWRHLAKLDRAIPLILRLSDGRAMVLAGFQPGAEPRPPVALLRDPLSEDDAVIAVDEVRLKAAWNGETIFIKRQYALRDEQRPFGFFWLTGQILREGRLFRDVAVAATLLSFFALIPPLLFMVILDWILVYQRPSSLYVLLGGIAFALVFETAFGYLKRHLVAIGTAKIDARISLSIFNRMIGLPIDFFERTPTGSIAYRLNEVWRIRQFLTGQLFGTALDTMTLVVLIPAMFILNAWLTLFVLGVAVLMFIVVLIYIPPIGRVYGQVVVAEQRKNSFLIEVLQGMRTVKSLALEGTKRRDWDARVAQAVRAQAKLQHLSNQPQTIMAPLERIIYSGSLALGAYLAITSDDAPLFAGTIVAFSMIVSRAIQPFVQIAGLLQQVEEVRGAIGQVASVVNLEPERGHSGRGVRPKIRGAINFSEVRFRYSGSQSFTLDRVSFTLPESSVTGIMGRSGSGKTTITRLLQGLHLGYEGLIKIDGVDLREIDIDHLRSNLGVVLQDNFLFNGTIRENIMAARTSASLEDVIQVARLAGAEEFIERLPRGYETMVEEGSANLSGGQRQRLAIARALLVDPPIIIFDEATSALDPESGAIVNSNLMRIARGRTVVVISHRLASLVFCDQILVLERGRVYDAGRHEDLLGRCDIYKHLWYQQNRHLAPDSSHDRSTLAPPARN